MSHVTFKSTTASGIRFVHLQIGSLSGRDASKTGESGVDVCADSIATVAEKATGDISKFKFKRRTSQ